MSFKLNLAIFKSTKPDSKVDFYGAVNIKVEQLDALCRYVMSQTPDEYGTVKVPISGWKKTSSKGVAYVAGVMEPPYGWVDPGDAAQSLATATGGEVVEADLF